MRRPASLLVALSLCVAYPALGGHPLHRPVVYVLDYGANLPVDEGFVPKATESPPHVLHIIQQTVFNSTWGAAYAGQRNWVPSATKANGGCLTVEALRKVEARLRAMTRKLRAGGIEVVAPYICNQTLAGNAAERTGIWAFYDRWDDYRAMGLGPKPSADPIRWLAREPDDQLHFNYETRHKAFVRIGQRRYAPCVNNPYYNAYLEAVVKWIGRVGMNGVFVDNCILNCYCEHCTRAFRADLAERYPPAERKRRFGTEDVRQIHLAERGNKLRFVLRDPRFRGFLQRSVSAAQRKAYFGNEDLADARLPDGGNGFLWTRAGEYRDFLAHAADQDTSGAAGSPDRWATGRPTKDWGIQTAQQRALWDETQQFWARSVARNLAKIKRWGSVDGKPFYVIPNWGAMQTVHGHEFREEIGHDVQIWAPAVDWIFYEEDTNPGRIADGLYLEFTLQHKYALAAGTPAVVMNYGRQDAPFTELAMAEGLAHGGGHVKMNWKNRPLHRKYRAFGNAFFEAYEGAKSSARVALALCYRETRMRNRAHLTELYEWVRYLGAQQILFDIVLDKHLTHEGLADYDVLIVPQVAHLSDAELEDLRAFRRRGGTLVCTGPFGDFDAAAQPRATRPRRAFLGPGSTEAKPGVSLSTDGRFVYAVSMRELVPQAQVTRDVIWAGGRSREALSELDLQWSSDAGRYKLMALLDRLARAHRYDDGGWLGRHLARTTTAWHHVADPRAAAGLRLTAFALDKPGHRRLAVHLINYNLPLTEKENPHFEPLENVKLEVPLPDPWQAASVTLRTPGRDAREIPYRQQGNVITATVPSVKVLTQLDIRCR